MSGLMLFSEHAHLHAKSSVLTSVHTYLPHLHSFTRGPSASTIYSVASARLAARAVLRDKGAALRLR